MAKFRKCPKEELQIALESSRSIAEALRRVGLNPRGANYKTVYNLIKEMNIDVSHMTGQGWNKGDVMGLRYYGTTPLEEILVADSRYTSTSCLRKRLVSSGLKKAVCESCSLETWNGRQIPLELNHINGDRFDHRLENLQLLCPNCHAQTETYRGRNKKR